MGGDSKNFRGWLALIVLVALVVRLGVFLYASPKPLKLYTPDSVGYDQLAVNLLEHGVFSAASQPPFGPDLERTPGYPAMLATVYAVTGHSPEAAILVQLLVAAAGVMLTAALATLLRLPRGVGLIAALVAALDPASAMTSDLLLSETLFTTLLVAALALMVLHWRSPRSRFIMAAAIVLGVAALVRPLSQFLPLLLVPIVAVAPCRRGPRAALGAAILFLAISMGITYSWAYRNYQAGGIFTVSTVADTNLVYYRAREVLASVEGIDQESARRLLEAQVAAMAPGRTLTPPERATLEQQEAFGIFRNHPVQTAAMLAKGAARIFADPGFTNVCTLLNPNSTSMECFQGEATMNESGSLGKTVSLFLHMTPIQQAALVGSALFLAIVYVLAAMGLVRMIRERRWFGSALLAVVFGYIVLLSSGSEAYSRFRIPVIPLLAIAAGMGLCNVWEWSQKRRALRGNSEGGEREGTWGHAQPGLR